MRWVPGTANDDDVCNEFVAPAIESRQGQHGATACWQGARDFLEGCCLLNEAVSPTLGKKMGLGMTRKNVSCSFVRWLLEANRAFGRPQDLRRLLLGGGSNASSLCTHVSLPSDCAVATPRVAPPLHPDRSSTLAFFRQARGIISLKPEPGFLTTTST